MKNTKLYLLILITAILYSCDTLPNNNDTSTDLSADYFQGYAILLATSTHNTGIVKVLSENHVLRGAIYKHEKGQEFNVFDTIVFKIKKMDGLQIAYDLRFKKDEKVIDTMVASGIVQEGLSMNLHNAVYHGLMHPEDRIHIAGHLLTKGGGTERISFKSSEERTSDLQLGDSEYIEIKICRDENTEYDDCEETVYITEEMLTKYNNLKEKNPEEIHFQIIIINGHPVIMDVTDKHIHFGDIKEFKHIEN